MKSILSIIFICLSLQLLAPGYPTGYIAVGEKIEPYEALWKAVCTVESHNDPNAFNPVESATGIAQVIPIRLKDYNTRTGEHLRLNEMYDPLKAKKVFMFYCKGNDIEKIARRWNGTGPKTDAYWLKIQRELKNPKI